MNRALLPALIGASIMAWGMPCVMYLLAMHAQCVERRACSLTLFSYAPWELLGAAVISFAGPTLLARVGKHGWATGLATVLLLAGSIIGVIALGILAEV